MKIYLSATWGNKHIKTLDRRGAKRLVSFTDTPQHKKAEAARRKTATKTVVPVNGLRGKRKKTSKPKSRPKGLGLG